MIGSYQGGVDRRLTPLGEGADMFASKTGHFDGRREVFVRDAGPSLQALSPGALIDTAFPFGQVLAGSQGQLRFTPSSKGKNRPGVRYTIPDAATGLSAAPYANYAMRDGAGTDESWSIFLVYSFDTTAENWELGTLACDNFEAKFLLYSNGVILATFRGDVGGSPIVVSATGSATTTADFNAGSVFVFQLSFYLSGGFYFRCVSLDKMVDAVYSNAQGYVPPNVGWDTTDARREGSGVFTLGPDNANVSPSGADVDIVLHEALYVPDWIQPSVANEFFADLHRKWVKKS